MSLWLFCGMTYLDVVTMTWAYLKRYQQEVLSYKLYQVNKLVNKGIKKLPRRVSFCHMRKARKMGRGWWDSQSNWFGQIYLKNIFNQKMQSQSRWLHDQINLIHFKWNKCFFSKQLFSSLKNEFRRKGSCSYHIFKCT